MAVWESLRSVRNASNLVFINIPLNVIVKSGLHPDNLSDAAFLENPSCDRCGGEAVHLPQDHFFEEPGNVGQSDQEYNQY